MWFLSSKHFVDLRGILKESCDESQHSKTRSPTYTNITLLPFPVNNVPSRLSRSSAPIWIVTLRCDKIPGGGRRTPCAVCTHHREARALREVRSQPDFYTVPSLILPVGIVRRRAAGVSRRVTRRLIATHRWANAHRSPEIFNRLHYSNRTWERRDTGRSSRRPILVNGRDGYKLESRSDGR